MNPPRLPHPRRPYWLLLGLMALLASPAAAATPVLLAIMAGAVALRTARFIARRRRSALTPAPGTSVLLGRDGTGRPAHVSDQQLAAHGLILGASGSGKSTTMLRILTEQIRRGGPVVALDLKGSPAFARVLQQAATSAGRPFRIWSPDGPSHWNPLQYGNATELKDKLIGTERFTEPHYQRAAERYVQTVLQVLQHAHPDRAPTLEEVVRLMEPRRLSSVLRAVPRPLAARVQDYVADLTADQLSAVRGLGTRLAVITESHVGGYLAAAGPAHSIDLRAALAGPDVVLFSLNSSSYGKLAAQIGTLVIQDLVSAAGERLNDDSGAGARGPVTVAVDEFSALGGDQLAALFARGREADMRVLVATQELVDLERASRGLRDHVLGNTTIKLVHRQEVPESAHIVAQMIGTEVVWDETRQIGAPFGYDTGRGTRRQVERFLVHPNTIKSLPCGQAVVISKAPEASVRIVQVAPPEQPAPSTRAQGPRAATATRGTGRTTRQVRARLRAPDRARPHAPHHARPPARGRELG